MYDFYFVVVWGWVGLNLKPTNSFLFWDTHDLEGLHGLREHVLVLLARNSHVAIRQESILAVVFQTQLGCAERMELIEYRNP